MRDSTKLPPLLIVVALAEPSLVQNSVMHSEHGSVAAQELTCQCQQQPWSPKAERCRLFCPSLPIRGGVLGLQKEML